MYPLDKLKTRLQSSHSGATVTGTLRAIVAEEGVVCAFLQVHNSDSLNS